ncbi:uncharacterized protein Dsimw501_GD29196, isoform B [Drosophila simulans]|nr:uncharacterized protein Dsimw501_GD29196, isoform B [Drosophila simulans]
MPRASTPLQSIPMVNSHSDVQISADRYRKLPAKGPFKPSFGPAEVNSQRKSPCAALIKLNYDLCLGHSDFRKTEKNLSFTFGQNMLAGNSEATARR